MDIKIDKDIPMPEKGGGGVRKTYPFADMQPGDSVFLPLKKNGANAALRSARKRGEIPTEWQWVREDRTEDGVEGVRIWRKS